MSSVFRHAPGSVLPPLRDDRKLALELRLSVAMDKEDAFQEACLAHLEGRNPAALHLTRIQKQRLAPLFSRMPKSG